MYKKFLKAIALFSLFYSISAVVKSHYQMVSINPITGKYECLSNNLLTQAEYIQEYVHFSPANANKKKILVAGACPGRTSPGHPSNVEDLGSRFDDPKNVYVFLDYTESADKTKPFLKVDFNNIDDLKLLKKPLSNTFDDIWMDTSVFKFAKWTKEHIQLLAALLKEGGSIVLPIGPTRSVSVANMITDPLQRSRFLSVINFHSQEYAESIRDIVEGCVSEFDSKKRKEADMAPLTEIYFIPHDEEMINLLVQNKIYLSYNDFLEKMSKIAQNRLVDYINKNTEGLSAEVDSNRKLPFETHYGYDRLLIITRKPDAFYI
jgi:hypothetical protein